MQLHADSIENALAEFISAAFSAEEQQIARLRARLDNLPPRSHARIVVQREIMEVRLRQLGGVL